MGDTENAKGTAHPKLPRVSPIMSTAITFPTVLETLVTLVTCFWVHPWSYRTSSTIYDHPCLRAQRHQEQWNWAASSIAHCSCHLTNMYSTRNSSHERSWVREKVDWDRWGLSSLHRFEWTWRSTLWSKFQKDRPKHPFFSGTIPNHLRTLAGWKKSKLTPQLCKACACCKASRWRLGCIWRRNGPQVAETQWWPCWIKQVEELSGSDGDAVIPNVKVGWIPPRVYPVW